MAKQETTDEKTARLRRLREQHERAFPRKKPKLAQKIFSLGDSLYFSKKHPNRTLEWIIDNNPGYIYWLLENSKDFEMTPEAEDYFRVETSDPRRPHARGVKNCAHLV